MTAPSINWERLGRLARRKLDRPAGPLGGAALRSETGLAKGHVDALARGGKMPALAYLRACDFIGVDPVTLKPLSSSPGPAEPVLGLASGETRGPSSPLGGTDTAVTPHPGPLPQGERGRAGAVAAIPPLGEEILWDFLGLAVMGARLSRGQTVEQAARAARVSTATLSRASHGRKVDAQALLRLAAWLGRHPHELTARAGTSAAPSEPIGAFGRDDAIEELQRSNAIAGRMEVAAVPTPALRADPRIESGDDARPAGEGLADAGSNEIKALQCGFPVKHSDVSCGEDANTPHDTAAEYTLAVAAIREMKVRAGEAAPNPDRPEEARWAAEGPVPVTDLETGRAGG